MPKRILAMPIGTFIALVAMTGRLTTVPRAGFAIVGMVLLVWGIGPVITSTRPVPAEHLQRASTPVAPAPMPRIPPSMFAGLNAQPAAPEPPLGIDPETGEVLEGAVKAPPNNAEDQPQGSAGAEPERPSPLPCPAKNPLAEPIEPPSAPVGPGAFVRWVKADRSGLGQIVDVGTEAAEVRPFHPCPTKQLTIPLRSLTTLTPNELAEALQ